MKISCLKIFFVFLFVFLSTSCAVTEVKPAFTDMDKDLIELKNDFNQTSDNVRLLFIISPT